MQADTTLYARYDHDRKPIAIQHDGMFVYANPAFLSLLGYQSFSELEAVPVLDLVIDRHKDRLREHFSEAGRVLRNAREYPRAKVTLLKNDGDRLVAIMNSCSILADGEESIEFSLTTEADTQLKYIFLHLPWKYYFSVLFLFLFTVLPNGLLLNLNINNAPKVYLPADAPSVIIDDELRRHFPSDQVVLLLFEGVALYSDGFARSLNALAESLADHPLIDDVVNMTTQDHIHGTEEGFLVEPLLSVRNLEKTRPPQRLERALSDRFARNALVAADGSAVAMLVIPVKIDSSLERLALEDAMLEEVRKARLAGYLTSMAGQITTDVAQMRSMLRDNMIFIPATTVIGLFLIWWLFHRWLAVIVAGVVIGVVVSSTVAFYVVFNQPFNLISSIIPPLLSALTVAALVHLFNALHFASKRGLTGPRRVRSALNEVQRPALYTALTTVAGLSSLGLSPIPPIKVFGLISAAGVVLIYFVVIHLVPNIFARFDYAPWPSRKSGLASLDRLVSRLLRIGVRYPLYVVGVVGVGLGLLLPQIGNIVVETNIQEFFYPQHPLRQATQHIEEKLVGTASLDIVFTAKQRGGLKQPRVLNDMRAFQRWAEAQPEVDKSISMADFVEEMHWGFNAEDPAYRRIPDNMELISQYLLVYDGEDLFDFVDRDYRIAHVSLNVNVHGANALSELMERIRIYLGEHPSNGVEWEIAGFGRLFADQEDLLIEGQVKSLFGALGLIFLLMLIQWRSIGGALLCMIPNLSPILLIFIIMGMFGLWLDMATAMIASVAVGIAVDDTIHIYHGFISRVRKGISPIAALVKTYKQAGRAVMTTTIILSAQFIVLTLSEFVPTTHFGLLTSIGLVTALFFDLLLLPALLVLIYARRPSAITRDALFMK
ncbi:MMPL family transporter [Sedimenticola hydrogenitrophicus]|uniref:MMPL family transporter n=1 Tax=Sedimenticola hydrogenitrophicus TaxID=2967975 RepID=UPI0021A95E9D|nr:MMPL family transporter [Sedimenticola hydrogenitrophicus]